MTIYRGTTGPDSFPGSSGDDLFNLGKGGNDTAAGGAGDDDFRMGAALNAGDRLDGGDDFDTVFLSGDYSAGLVFTGDMMVNIEALRLGAGHNYNLTMSDDNVAADETLRVNASRLGAANHLTFDGSAEQDGHFIFDGGAGDDTITGGAKADVFHLDRGGKDIVHGGGGNDDFFMKAGLAATDQIDGGAGGADRVTLNGSYSLTLGAATMTNVETLRLVGNHNYSLTMNDGNVALGETLTVNAAPLTAGNHLTFNGAPELNGHFSFFDSHGDDAITGGAQSDTFDFSNGGTDTAHGGGGDDTFNLASDFTTADSIDGGAGSGDAVAIDDSYIGGAALVFGAATMTNVEFLNLGSGHLYDITTDNNTVAGTATLTVNGATLGAGETLTFHGGNELDGHFVINAGAGNDVLTGGFQSDTFDISTGGGDIVDGGDGNDTVRAGAEYNLSDGIEGGNGYDTIELAGIGAATYSGANTLHLTSSYLDNFEQITVDGGGDYHIILEDSVATSTFTIDASGLLAADTLEFDGAAETLSSFVVKGGAHFDASDSIRGGDAYDTLELNGDYTGANALTFGATTMTAFEQITCDAGHSYDLTTDAATTASGVYLYVDASALAAGETLTFDGTASFDAAPGLSGNLVILGGAGDDVIIGADANGLSSSIELNLGGDDTATGLSGDDNFYMGGALTADDTIDGGTGYNQVFLSGDYSGVNALTFSPTTMVNIDYLTAGIGFDYHLTTDDATVAAGEVLGVNASPVSFGNTFYFDGSAETDGSFSIVGGAGANDYLIGGDKDDEFAMYFGGDDTVYAGSGDDHITFGVEGFDYTGALTAADTIDGGTGNDTVNVSGDYTGANALVFGATTMINVENFTLFSGDGDFTTDNATVAAGATLTFGAIGALTFDGSAETDGHFIIYTGTGPDPAGSGAVSDFLIGGALSDTFFVDDTTFHYPSGNDTVTGGGGGDLIHASSNPADFDTFIYNGVSDSTSVGFDTFTNMNFDNDVLEISTFATLPGTIDTAVTSGTLTMASFDSQLAAAIGAGQLGPNEAVLFTPSSGLTTQTFLIVDVNGTAGYQASADLVFDITGYSGTLSTADFS